MVRIRSLLSRRHNSHLVIQALIRFLHVGVDVIVGDQITGHHHLLELFHLGPELDAGAKSLHILNGFLFAYPSSRFRDCTGSSNQVGIPLAGEITFGDGGLVTIELLTNADVLEVCIRSKSIVNLLQVSHLERRQYIGVTHTLEAIATAAKEDLLSLVTTQRRLLLASFRVVSRHASKHSTEEILKPSHLP